MHRASMDETDKLKGKYVIVDLQERKISAFQKDIIWLYFWQCKWEFILLAKIWAVKENKFEDLLISNSIRKLSLLC